MKDKLQKTDVSNVFPETFDSIDPFENINHVLYLSQGSKHPIYKKGGIVRSKTNGEIVGVHCALSWNKHYDTEIYVSYNHYEVQKVTYIMKEGHKLTSMRHVIIAAVPIEVKIYKERHRNEPVRKYEIKFQDIKGHTFIIGPKFRTNLKSELMKKPHLINIKYSSLAINAIIATYEWEKLVKIIWG